MGTALSSLSPVMSPQEKRAWVRNHALCLLTALGHNKNALCISTNHITELANEIAEVLPKVYLCGVSKLSALSNKVRVITKGELVDLYTKDVLIIRYVSDFRHHIVDDINHSSCKAQMVMIYSELCQTTYFGSYLHDPNEYYYGRDTAHGKYVKRFIQPEFDRQNAALIVRGVPFGEIPATISHEMRWQGLKDLFHATRGSDGRVDDIWYYTMAGSQLPLDECMRELKKIEATSEIGRIAQESKVGGGGESANTSKIITVTFIENIDKITADAGGIKVISIGALPANIGKYHVFTVFHASKFRSACLSVTEVAQ